MIKGFVPRTLSDSTGEVCAVGGAAVRSHHASIRNSTLLLGSCCEKEAQFSAVGHIPYVTVQDMAVIRDAVCYAQ